MGAFVRPSDLQTALGIRAETGARPLAGGTDLFPADAVATGWGGPGLDELDLLDLSGIAELAAIEVLVDRIELGALVTWADVLRRSLPPWLDGLRQAAREVGGMQIQNRGTLAGNLCNASPAADGVPPLLALDARVRLQRPDGVRELALAEFLTGNRRTALAPDELLTHIVVPKQSPAARSVFLKLGARRYLVISIAMVAVTSVLDEGGRLADLRIALGACSAVARRLVELESRLGGLTPAEAAQAVEARDVADLEPIDDIRASAAYRRHAALVLIRRALTGHPVAAAA
jgi:N-methylhydantoinase B